MSAEKWPRSVVRRRDEEAKSGLCAFLGAASNIPHIVRINTWMTYYPPVCASYKYSTWKISSCQLHRGQMYTERFFKSSRVIEVGPEVSWGRRGRQTNLFKPKKATSVLCQSHTFKGKLVPSIHSDETQTISNLFQYCSHRNNNKAQMEILLRPQTFIKGKKNLLC